MSRLTVAWVTSKPRAESSATSSPWLPIGWAVTMRRMAACRSRLTVTACCPLMPRRPWRRGARTRVPKLGSVRARTSASGAEPSAMMASAPSQERADNAARTLGTMPPRMMPDCDQRVGLGGVDGREAVAVRPAHPVDVRHEDQLASAEAGREPRGGVVRVDVADDAVLVPGERRDHRHLAADHQLVEQVPAHAGHRRDEPHVGEAVADEQPAVDAAEADRVAARVAQRGDELAVDDAPQDRGRHLERGRVRDAQPVHEAGLDAEALQPLGDALAAAVDEHDRARAGDLRDLAQHLLLLRERRPADLDDDDVAHVVYSEFSLT